MRRLLRTAVSLLIVLVTYVAYAVTAVPLIDPQSTLSSGPTPPPPPGRKIPLPPNDPMAIWFPDPHAWQRNQPKKLRNDRVVLLFNKYSSDPKKLGPGKVRLWPWSIVFLHNDESLDPQTRNRQAIIVEGPNLNDGDDTGAVLQFDRRFNLRRGVLGKLRRGTLVGEITIRSEGKSPGIEDDLRIVTHDVRLTPSRIWTSAKVHFEYGPNRGQGKGLDIKLLPEDERGPSELGRVRSLTLKEHVELDLVVKDGGSESRTRPPRQTMPSPGGFPSFSPPREFFPEVPIVVRRGAPVTVRCQGPFHFDAAENQATFEQQVVVQRQHPGGGTDTLTADHLTLSLERPDEPSDGGTAPRLQVRRMTARGNPAVLEAPASAVYAHGQRLEYDLLTRRVSLVDEKQVVFKQEANFIQARELHYQPGAEGRLGHFQAEGAGKLDWAVRDVRQRTTAAHRPGEPQTSRRFLANWQRQLHSTPHEGRQLISMLGKASARVTDMGQLDGEEIHAWLFERPQPGTMTVDASGKKKQKYDLVPDRMLAKTHVTINAPQLTGRTQKLEVIIHHPTATPAHVATHSVSGTPRGGQPRAGPAPPQAPTAGVTADPNRPTDQSPADAGRRFDVAGERIQVQLEQVGRQAQLSQLDIFKRARVLETKTAKPGERPMLVVGDSVHAKRDHNGHTAMKVRGKPDHPAHVEGRGLSLTGGLVNLDQGVNRVWIDGPGAMTLLTDRDLNGKTQAQPQPMRIDWQGRMHFDGLRAVFESTPETSVLAQRGQEMLRTKTLEAILDRRVDLAKLKQQSGERPQIDRVLCRGGAFMKRRESDPKGLVSYEEMETVDLSVDQLSGAVVANGPGWIKRWSRKDGESELGFPGAASRETAKRTVARPQPLAARVARPGSAVKEDENGLNYLKVNFQAGLRGNHHQRVMVFRDQVEAVHAPVANWGDTVNPDRLEQLGPRGVALKCDELQLTEVRAGEQKWVEAMAVANTVAEGQTFTAMGSRIRYSQGKDLLVLEGTDRTPAELWRQQAVGAPRSNLKARKIEYWRSANRIVIDKGQHLDVSETPAPTPRGRPSAPPR